MSSRRYSGVPVLPLGVLHSPFVCAFCGATSDLRLTVLGLTRAEAAVCLDPIECVRRQMRRKEIAA